MSSKKKETNNKTNSNLKEQFKQFVPEEKAPEELKKEVFNSLDTINLLADVVDLFTGKFAKTESNFFELLSDSLSEDEMKDSDEEMNPGSSSSSD